MSKAASKKKVTDFTGIARTLICENNNGFRNFRVVTFHILNGEIVRETKSDCYVSFEAMARLDAANERSAIKLNNRWEEGLGMRDFDSEKEPELPPDPIGGRLR